MATTQDLARILLSAIPLAQAFSEEDVIRMAQAIEDSFGKPHLPADGESVGVTLAIPKTAALFFDRVWSPPGYFEEGPPDDIAVYGATSVEIWSLAVYQLARKGRISEEVLARLTNEFARTDVGPIFIRESPFARDLSDALRDVRGVQAVPLFDSQEALKQEYRSGSYEIVVAALQEVRIVDETRLHWDQVQQLRSDKEARRKYRRFIRWLDDSMVGHSGIAIADEIAARFEQYDLALKKHGISTIVGTLEVLIDPKFAAAGAALIAGLSMAGVPLTAAGTSAAALYLGKAACTVTRGLLDIHTARRTQNPEIAFLHQIRPKDQV